MHFGNTTIFSWIFFLKQNQPIRLIQQRHLRAQSCKKPENELVISARFPLQVDISCLPYTAVSRKVVGKSTRDNPERYCGWFCLPCSPKKFERMAREATDVCSRMLMESNKSRLNSDSLVLVLALVLKSKALYGLFTYSDVFSLANNKVRISIACSRL